MVNVSVCGAAGPGYAGDALALAVEQPDYAEMHGAGTTTKDGGVSSQALPAPGAMFSDDEVSEAWHPGGAPAPAASPMGCPPFYRWGVWGTTGHGEGVSFGSAC